MLNSFFAFIKKLVLLVFCFAALFVGGLFAYENPEKISPIIFGHTLPDFSLGLYLVFILFLGIVIGLVLSFWGSQTRQFRLKAENRRLKKASSKDQRQVSSNEGSPS